MFTDLYIHNIPFYIYIVNTLLITHSFFHKKKDRIHTILNQKNRNYMNTVVGKVFVNYVGL